MTTETKATHTPGPWFDDGYRIYAPTDSDDPCAGRVIVEYKHVDDFNLADAPLITACPELLDACEAALDWPQDDPVSWAEVCNQLRAAIAKARGEST